MKKVKIRTLKDNRRFRISARKNTTYRVVRKEKGFVFYESIRSARTFKCSPNKIVYIF